MKSKASVALVLLAGFALLLSCQTAMQSPVGKGAGNIRIVKLTVPDCG
jgi:hypothetical protein